MPKTKVSGGKDRETIGVIVARFQVAELHMGHIHLIMHVLGQHDKVLIVLGCRDAVRSRRDPLTFEERKQMILGTLPGSPLTILPLMDHPNSSARWSSDLDALIEGAFPGCKAKLYGSRGSFIPHYSGKFPTNEVRAVLALSGTDIRKEYAFPHTRDARAAIIYEMEHRYPFMYSTVDIAVVDKKGRRVLLIGKNAHDGKLTFPGGHIEKVDETALNAARREFAEEVYGVGFGLLEYVVTRNIDDPKYKDTPDGVSTTFYVTEYQGGEPFRGDSDADSVHWVSYENLLGRLAYWHRPLGELLLQKLGITPASPSRQGEY